MSTTASLLTFALGAGVILCAASAVHAWFSLRVRVYEFLRSERPDLWSRLNPDGDVAYSRLVGRGLVSPNRQLRDFVKTGHSELSDPEVASRCASANAAEKRSIYLFLGLLVTALALFAGIVAGV